jgi:type I restriction enzyme S subunit
LTSLFVDPKPDWGELPKDWKLIPLKYGFDMTGSGTTPTTGKEAYFEGPTPWVTTSELRENIINATAQNLSKKALEDFSSLKIFPKGSVLIAMYGATIGRLAILGIPACVNQAVFAMAQPIFFEPRFVFYALQASRDYLLSLSSGGGQPNLNAEKIGNHEIPCPPAQEQRLICQYLDRQTAKIDALISAKQKLLTLLAEKRRALITHAVTCGINSDASFCTSGVEWLGNIPKHWNVELLKFHLSNIEQGWSPQSYSFPADEDEWGVLKVGAVNGWEFNPNENKCIPEDLEIPFEYEIKAGDILVSRANTTELVGSAALVRQVRPQLLLCDKLYRPRISSDRLLPEFLVFYLRSLAGRFLFERDATGASGSMQNISQEILANLWIPIPPIDEQRSIIGHIRARHADLEKLESATERVIELLKERRIALISSAVTGKIAIPA